MLEMSVRTGLEGSRPAPVRATPVRATPVRATRAESEGILAEYYDTEWGVPLFGEAEVFERLCLEGFQAGLAWITVLKKREALRRGFAGFDPDRVAGFTADDVERLLGDPGLIRNRRKIEATVDNARATLRLREAGHDLASLVWSYMPSRTPVPVTDAQVPTRSAESAALAKDLKRRGFKFVGPTTVYALMGALGIVDLHLVTSRRRGRSGLWNPDGTRSEAGESVRLLGAGAGRSGSDAVPRKSGRAAPARLTGRTSLSR